ncbi:hypothetical protein [uncultured Desulfobacter sp.]|uniref:hypothetical protein n=1 Tax=uncultured Desulfobacter sp. TaxID=240139 RepID=UPI002AA8D127|nr:hypothetical protein [uncultured Desulfobacter sp.]
MKRLFLVLAAMILMAGSAQAEIVANWDMADEPGDQEYTEAAGAADYITAFDMVRGTGLSNSYTGNNSLNSNGWGGTDADDYLEFGFSVADGYEVTLSELWLGTRSSNTGPGTIGVYSSVDEFNSSVYTITQQGSSYSNNIIDLSSLGTIPGDFSIRLYEIGNLQADDDGETADTGTFRITDYYYSGSYIDVQFVGTVAASAGTSPVPVPNAVILLGWGLIGLAGIKRKIS